MSKTSIVTVWSKIYEQVSAIIALTVLGGGAMTGFLSLWEGLDGVKRALFVLSLVLMAGSVLLQAYLRYRTKKELESREEDIDTLVTGLDLRVRRGIEVRIGANGQFFEDANFARIVRKNRLRKKKMG